MNSSSVVTVIVPVLDQQTTIHKILDGVKNLTYRPLRLIVVDNGCSDETVKLALEWFSFNREQTLQCYVLSRYRPIYESYWIEEISSARKLWLNQGEIPAPDAVDQYFREENLASFFNWLRREDLTKTT